ncbi:MAG: hypothetical protein U0K29_00030 [Prevotella sp.]|nr:hypothetical protein [Prevotella sp.]
MKSSELNKIMRLLNFPDIFKKKGRLAYYTLTHKTGAIVLVGFYLDNSIDPNSFFVNYFAQCLYVPFCTYNFSLGDRIGSYWQIDRMPDLQDKINNFDVFNELNTFEDFLAILKKHPYYGSKTGRDVYFAFTNYILKDYGKSEYFLDKIISLKKRDNHNLFSHEIENVQFLKDCIEKCNYDKGINQILLWQAQTINGLGLRLSI